MQNGKRIDDVCLGNDCRWHGAIFNVAVDIRPGAAHAIRYDDPDIIWTGRTWPKGSYIISEKDKNGMKLKEFRDIFG